MKIKTAELTGVALDWAVAKCEVGAGFIGEIDDPHFYSTDWALGGPIMEREGIDCTFHPGVGAGYWTATHVDYYDDFESPSLLEAVMRRYVANKIGDEVEIPDEILKGDANV